MFLSAAGCAKKNASVYYSNGVKLDSICTVEAHTLNDSSIWRFPLQMECTDSLLVILDYMDDCYFHVYTLSGNPKGKFARKGKGPGELLSANQFHLSLGKDTLYVYDGVSRKLVAYNLDTNLERDRSLPSIRWITAFFLRLKFLLSYTICFRWEEICFYSRLTSLSCVMAVSI